jgi:hypothetical protein
MTKNDETHEKTRIISKILTKQKGKAGFKALRDVALLACPKPQDTLNLSTYKCDEDNCLNSNEAFTNCQLLSGILPLHAVCQIVSF